MNISGGVLFLRDVHRFTFIFLVVGSALTLVGARWDLIAKAGSPVPYHDQWFAEGWVVYTPAVEGRLEFASFVYPHNDHRIVPTKLLAYGLFRANGQWDARVQMTANALIAAGVLGVLLGVAGRWLRGPWLATWAVMLTWFYAQPIFYENALWGFQSQFYFLILFSLLQIHLMLSRTWRAPSWWIGVGSGVVAISSMGSGLLASVIVGVVAIWRGRGRGVRFSPERVTALVATGGVIAGLAWMPPLTGGTTRMPDSATIKTLFHALAFPARLFSWSGCWVWLPFFALLTARALGRVTLQPGQVSALAAGGWVLLQIAALSHARADSGLVLANRYYDLFAVGVAVNAMIVVWCWHCFAAGWSRKVWTMSAAAGAAWLMMIAPLVVDLCRVNRGLVAQFAVDREETIRRVRAFVSTNDESFLLKPGPGYVLPPDPARLVEFLRAPALRSILPAEVRAPIPITFSESPGALALNNAMPPQVPHEPGWTHRGTFLPASGAASTFEITSNPASKASRSGLVFRVAGDLQPGQTELRIKDGRGNVAAVITNLRSDTLRPVDVDVSGKAFQVEVVDRSESHWLAWTDPVERGPLSRLALRCVAWGDRLVAWGGIVLLIALLPTTIEWFHRFSSGRWPWVGGKKKS